MCLKSLESFKKLICLQVRVSDYYYSFDDSAHVVDKVLKSNTFHITQEQSLQDDDTRDIVRKKNSQGTFSGSWKLTLAIVDVGFTGISISVLVFPLTCRFKQFLIFFPGTSVSNWFSSVKQKGEGTNFLHVPRVLIYFLERLVMLFRGLTLEFWRTQTNICPSISMEHNNNNLTVAGETLSERDHILRCIQRLERLEIAFGELRHKPAGIPLEKEQMLMNSLDRIKSVEFDLDKTKRVFLYACICHL